MLRLRFGFWFDMKTTTFLPVWVKSAVSLLGMVKNLIGFFFCIFVVAENMIILIFDITYGKFASVFFLRDDDDDGFVIQFFFLYYLVLFVTGFVVRFLKRKVFFQ